MFLYLLRETEYNHERIAGAPDEITNNNISWDILPGRRLPMFRRNVFHAPSGSKSTQNTVLVACCLFGLIFYSEDGVNTFLRNADKLPRDYMASHHRKQYFSNQFPRLQV
jgi:hypothetical protein